MKAIDRRTKTYAPHSQMPLRDIMLIIRNDTRTETASSFAAPRPQRTGWMLMEELWDEVRSGWTQHRHHRRPDLPPPTTVTGVITGAPFTEQHGAITFRGTRIPHMTAMQGARVMVRREDKATAFDTLPLRRFKRAALDAVRLGVTTLRRMFSPDEFLHGLPSRRSLRKQAGIRISAYQFVEAHGGNLTRRIRRNPDQFATAHGGDTRFKIRKEPLQSLRPVVPNKHPDSPVYTPGPDGIPF